MKICLVSTELLPIPIESWGAIEGQVEAEALALATLGHEVHVVTVSTDNRRETVTLDGVRYHRLGMANAYRSSASSMLAGLATYCRRTKRLVAELAPDIVHYHARYPCLYASMPARTRRNGPKMFFHAHNWKMAEEMAFPRLSPRRLAKLVGARADRRIAHGCDHLLAVSRFMRERIVATSAIDEQKVSVLPNVVDVETFSPDPTVERNAEIVFIGRIAAEKGVATLIEAMTRIAAEYPEASLSIIGPDKGGSERGAYLRDCKRRVERLGLASHINFLGEVPNAELPAVLRRCRVSVTPSIWGEPFGLVVIEALACGTPVVASRVGAIPELVEEGETGLLAPPGDAEKLADCIIQAMTDQALARTAADRGPRFVRENHGCEVVGGRLLKVYESALNGGPQSTS